MSTFESKAPLSPAYRSSMPRGLVAIACFGVLLLGCIEPSEPLARGRAAVRQGADDAGDPAVVSIYKTGVVLCTGALITPRVVVTAAHCLHPDLLSGHAVTELEVRFGPQASPAESQVAIAEGLPHPDFDPSSLDLTDNPDVGVVRLAEPVDVPPLGIQNDAILPLLVPGAPLRVVGYGVTAYGAMDYGTKREATATIQAVDAHSMSLAPPAMCAGDSGGPYLFAHEGNEYVVAAHSNGNCTTTSEGTPIATVYDSFVLPFIEKDCVADGACLELCKNVVDPDCSTGGTGGAGGASEGTGGADPGAEPAEEDGGGCAVAPARSGGRCGWLALALIGLLACGRGRRRAVQSGANDSMRTASL